LRAPFVPSSIKINNEEEEEKAKVSLQNDFVLVRKRGRERKEMTEDVR
jgi:hypothetical protein